MFVAPPQFRRLEGLRAAVYLRSLGTTTMERIGGRSRQRWEIWRRVTSIALKGDVASDRLGKKRSSRALVPRCLFGVKPDACKAHDLLRHQTSTPHPGRVLEYSVLWSQSHVDNVLSAAHVVCAAIEMLRATSRLLLRVPLRFARIP